MKSNEMKETRSQAQVVLSSQPRLSIRNSKMNRAFLVKLMISANISVENEVS